MRFRGDVARLLASLALANVVVWALALVLFREQPVLLGAASLAWILGLRHAVDADHIAAIDGATRKLVHGTAHAPARPMLTGLFFSLGHSTVVWLAAIGAALVASAASPGFARVREIGSVVGPGVSVLFLFAIAIANLFVLASLVRAFRRGRHGESAGDELDERLVPGGPLARLFRPLFRLVTRSRHMFLVGVLFGLGFDTATEIMVLGISASAATHGAAIWSILIFPALFTAAMSLVDTLDSALMARAYGWAFVQPRRKLTYNIAVTFASVVVALAVGTVQVMAMVSAGEGGFAGWLRQWGGYAAIALFAALWLAARAAAARRARA
ncbi:HoxN/HupN/NixA family nickel/cobalt transporter [Novosphingobium sp. ZN18A2]|uniref:HoxN/HupN/NixA family nickel/cobalt transporter n=1 Tax=Novosphingobium sp. ZN18A2 TaxID=3079861 RepID=UPI0030CCA72B